MAVVLASSSPRRQLILQELGFAPLIVPSAYDEETFDPAVHSTPEAYVIKMALGKADEVRGRVEAQVVIGADTVVVLDGEVMGKPLSPEKAKETLRKLSGRTHGVLTATCLLWNDGFVQQFIDKTKVTMHPFTQEEIDVYVATGEPL